MAFEFHPQATEEVAEAAAWYAERSTRASSEFIARVYAAVALIHDLPLASPLWRGVEEVGIRKHGIRGYPYFIAYVPLREKVVVLAVAHAKRRPFYWLARVNDL